MDLLPGEDGEEAEKVVDRRGRNRCRRGGRRGRSRRRSSSSSSQRGGAGELGLITFVIGEEGIDLYRGLCVVWRDGAEPFCLSMEILWRMPPPCAIEL